MKKSRLLSGAIALTLFVIVGASVYFYFSRKSPAANIHRDLAIESKGLSEFNAENDNTYSISARDKKLFEEMNAIIQAMGDGKDADKNKRAVIALGGMIHKYPDYSDAYFLRATLSLLTGDNYARQALSDIDNAIKFQSPSKYKEVYDSAAEMYALRAKADILAEDYPRAMSDLETGIKDNPSNINDVFNTGGVKPEEEPNSAALLKKDLDLLVVRYPGDYRSFLFRGLFYNAFSFYNEDYYAPTFSDLQKALQMNPNSALVNYFLGSVFQKQGLFTKAAASDASDTTGARGGYKERINETALKYFDEAIKLDPYFAEAYSQAAESLSNLKRHSEAIPFYDRAISFNPNNFGLYNDRGLAKASTNDYYGAISDFSKAIELSKSNTDLSSADTYENRAAAYIKVKDYDTAIEDYSRQIGLTFASRVFLMSIPQIRATYPELHDIPDQELLEELREKYYPNMSRADFVGQYEKNQRPYEDFVLANFYVDRGDAYLGKHTFKKAANEYSRAIHEDSTYTFDRWKLIAQTSDRQYLIDVKTISFNQEEMPSLWVRALDTQSKGYTEDNFQLDCSGRKMKSISSIGYNSLGDIRNTSAEQQWESIVPESIGEILYSGMCENR